MKDPRIETLRYDPNQPVGKPIQIIFLEEVSYLPSQFYTHPTSVFGERIKFVVGNQVGFQILLPITNAF